MFERVTKLLAKIAKEHGDNKGNDIAEFRLYKDGSGDFYDPFKGLLPELGFATLEDLQEILDKHVV